MNLVTTEPEGVEWSRDLRATPDERGVLARFALELPPFERACYWASFQKYDPMPEHQGAYPDGTNRVQALRVADFADLTEGGIFALLQLQSGEFLALLPLCGPQSAAWLGSGADGLQLSLGTFGTAPFEGDAPLLAWARDADPYEACRRVWARALQELGFPTRAREEKAYPEPFRFLGWCSWEEYRFDISEALLLDAVERIEASGLPIRTVLVDDGHLDVAPIRAAANENDAEANEVEGGDGTPQNVFGSGLRSFAPDARKFPRGWEALLSRRNPDGVRWMGVWLNFNGYWNALHPRNEFGALNAQLEASPCAGLVPRDDLLSAFAFYDAMIGAARAHGFDFVKVDNQSAHLKHCRGLGNGVSHAVHASQALEAACARHMDGLINCMAHGPACLFNTRVSNVTRCSEDYLLGDEKRARRHLHNSYANLPWLGQTAWGDHDMFHSDDPASGHIMAASKALSGGPVLLSDSPERFRHDNILPLCWNDGGLLRPLAPAAPLPASLFADPFSEAVPYGAAAPLPGGAATLVFYNLTEPVAPVRGAVTSADYEGAAALLSPAERAAWRTPAEGVVLWDWEAGTGRFLDGEYPFEIAGFDHFLALLCPVRNGWAVVGRADKFLSPCGVETLDASATELLLRLRESGPLTLWSRAGAPQIAGCEAQSLGENCWRFDLPEGETNVLVRVTRAL